jgi:23S rRNA (uracil1939-C5)-methyltransferase
MIELDLTTFTYGGESLGRLPDGRAVFVPFALPGEKVRVRLTEEKRSHARADLVEVLEPSPERIQPLCIHFGECGGCHYQHIPYPLQLEIKRNILREQLERIGGLDNPPVLPAVPSPRPYYYRNHVQFHLTRDGKLGYHRFHSETVFAARECHLPEERLNVVWPQLDFEMIPEIERVGLRLGAEDDVQLILESSDIQAPELSVEEMSIAAVHLSEAGSLVLAGSEYTAIEVLGRPFRVSAGSFFQVNTPMAEAMVSHILENLEKLQPQGGWQAALDVYCGAGLFSAFLAPLAARLTGIEENPYAAEDFVVNLDEFENVELYEAPAGAALPAINLQADLVLVDPPRVGLERAALDAILHMSPAVLVYVSCDPSTLARDARRLVKGGYSLSQTTPFDLFPQTYHIESVSLFLKS